VLFFVIFMIVWIVCYFLLYFILFILYTYLHFSVSAYLREDIDQQERHTLILCFSYGSDISDCSGSPHDILTKTLYLYGNEVKLWFRGLNKRSLIISHDCISRLSLGTETECLRASAMSPLKSSLAVPIREQRDRLIYSTQHHLNNKSCDWELISGSGIVVAY
jgi:hypothetical protein